MIKKQIESKDASFDELAKGLEDYQERVYRLENTEIEEKLNEINNKLVTGLIADLMAPIQAKQTAEFAVFNK